MITADTTFTVPLRVSISITVEQPGTAEEVVTPEVTAAQTDTQIDPAVLAEGMARLEANRDRPYYDSAADTATAESYYQGVDNAASPTELITALKDLLEQTHTRPRAYKPSDWVYPWVDLHPDRKLRSIYSGKAFAPEELIREDARVEAMRTRRLQALVASESAIGPGRFADELTVLDAEMPFNCEHVVPQSSFDKAEPMRGDLHHLFACESRCNSFRGNIPYFDFTDFEEVLRQDCGKREPDRFEPISGKGAVARATMYFLVRYPGVVGDVARELQAERMSILLAWHEADPVGEWERHRNAAIAEIQGNRNPLIDHPDWAGRIAFDEHFGQP